MTEREIQKRIVQRLKDLGLLFLHVPNEGKRNPKTAALLKSMGMRRGAPDLLIFDSPLDGSKGLALEVKTEKGKTSIYQDLYLSSMRERGWKAEVGKGLIECERIIEMNYSERDEQ